MKQNESFNSWLIDEDLFFSDTLTAFMHSLDVYTFGDLLDKMDEIVERMEADDRVDLVNEYKKHLIRLEDMMEHEVNKDDKYRFTPPELIRGQTLVELGYSHDFLAGLAEHHIYTIGALMDSRAEWKEIFRSLENDTIRNEFTECLQKITNAIAFGERTN